MGSPVETGTVLDGRYRVERVIGMGAMGIVVAAQHIALRERVALKFLKKELTESRTILARFEREARAATRIKSEHIARVRDVGRLETGEPYMVMEYLEGKDLAAHVRDRGPLPLREAADYVLQACEALAEAHSLGIVHRDLKPENLFLTHRADGSACIKVLDFGISKFSDTGATSSFTGTVAGGLVGSPLYMSPEQISAAPDVDARSDVWGVGVIFFELLSGKTPFSGTSLPQVCMSITGRPHRSLSQIRPELPLRVEQLVDQCLEKDRDKRLASVADVARKLAEFASDHGRISAARAARIAAGAGASSSSEAMSPSSRPMVATELSLPPRLPGSSQVPRLAIGLGVAGVVLVSAAVALFAARGERARAPQSSVVTSGGVFPPRAAAPGASVRTTAPALAPRDPVVSAVPRADATPAVSAVQRADAGPVVSALPHPGTVPAPSAPRAVKARGPAPAAAIEVKPHEPAAPRLPAPAAARATATPAPARPASSARSLGGRL